MIIRKILYGYRICQGELAIVPDEAAVVRQVMTMYINGLSYQKISDVLNSGGTAFSAESPLWNKNKVKRLLENPRYTGADGYPPISEKEIYETIQRRIQEKTVRRTQSGQRPAQLLKRYLFCGNCRRKLLVRSSTGQRRNVLYLRCSHCGMRTALPDSEFLARLSRQMTEHNSSVEKTYTPSAEAVRLANAINRGLEKPEQPEAVAALILQGIAARYDSCSDLKEYKISHRPAETDISRFGQAVSHIYM